MLSVALDRLIDRLLALATEQREKRERLLQHLIDPLHEDVGTVHQGWLSSFAAYREVVRQDDPNQWVTLLDRIWTDSLHSAHLRSRVRAVIDTPPPPAVAAYFEAVRSYLVSGLDSWPDADHPQYAYLRSQNRRRADLFSAVAEVLHHSIGPVHHGLLSRMRFPRSDSGFVFTTPGQDDQENQTVLISTIDAAALDLQLHYSQVQRSYAKVRRDLALG